MPNYQLPEGYKQTEVGVIPEDWEVVAFLELFDFQNGVNADKKAYGQGIPFINVLEVITKTHLDISDIPGRVFLSKKVIEAYAVQKGDILFNRTSETQEEVGLASVYLGDESVVFGGFVIRGRNLGNSIDSVYSGYAFRSPSIRSQIIARGQGAVRANIGQQDLYKVLTVLPKWEEQRAIATALSDVDALIAALDKLIAKKRYLKTATMQQLLTGKKRLLGFGEGKGYQQTEVGVIPEDWEVVPLKVLCKVNQGLQIAIEERLRYPTSKSRSYITIQAINSGEFTEYIDTYSTSVCCEKNDVLMTRTGNTGIVVTDVSGVFHNNFFKVDFDRNKLDKEFFVYYLRADKTQRVILEKAGTSTIPDLNHNDFYSINVALPSFKEQRAISTVLSDMDSEIAAIEARRAKTQAIKQGMMQELLTGRTRLV